MDFLSLTFGIFFILSVICYYAVPKRLRWCVLLLASIIFYIWSAPKLIIYLLFSTVTSYLYGRQTEKCEKKSKGVLLAVIGANLLVLLGLKFYPLLRMRFDFPAWKLLLPMGISFYTLQMIAYCVDVYRGKIKAQDNFLKYLLFMSFFPQILQGPIPRYEKLGHQLYEGHTFNYRTVTSGLQLMLWGFFLKMVIADRAAIFVNTVFPDYHLYEGTMLLVAALLYSVQLYTDFLGCVCIAMGAAQVYGIRLETNFNRPYTATSIKDFWRRWHISLSSWLRDYVYIPLGGNRKGIFRKHVNLVLTFLVSGIWHGAGLNFIFWGLLHGGCQIAGELTQTMRRKVRNVLKINEQSSVYFLWQRFVTFALVTAAWVIFRAESLRAGLSMLKRIVTDWTPWVLFDGSLYTCGISSRSFAALMFCIVLVIFVEHLQGERTETLRERLAEQHLLVRWAVCLGGIALVVIFGVYGPGYDAAQFLYGQF